jgi:hypothetical protein
VVQWLLDSPASRRRRGRVVACGKEAAVPWLAFPEAVHSGPGGLEQIQLPALRLVLRRPILHLLRLLERGLDIAYAARWCVLPELAEDDGFSQNKQEDRDAEQGGARACEQQTDHCADQDSSMKSKASALLGNQP